MAIRVQSVAVLLLCLALSWCFAADAALTQRAGMSLRRQARQLSVGDPVAAAGPAAAAPAAAPASTAGGPAAGGGADAGDEEDDDDDDDDEDAPDGRPSSSLTKKDAGDDDEELRSELKKLKRSALRKRAVTAGITEESLEEADDADDAKTAYIELIIAHHAAETARLSKKVVILERALADNAKKQAELERNLKQLSDDSKSNREIESAVIRVANETESMAMANMLGQMWKEMRMFEVPFYSKHIGEQLRNLTAEERVLKEKLVAARREWKAAKEKKTGKVLEKGKMEKEDENTERDEAKKGSTYGAQNYFDKLTAVNVWALPKEQRHKVFEYSFVYLIGGLLCAFLYKLAFARYPAAFAPRSRGDKLTSTGAFSFSIFGCFGDLRMCAAGFLCPFCRWAQTMDSKGLLSYWLAFTGLFCLSLLHVYTMGISSLVAVALGVVYRQKLRGIYRMERGTPTTVALDAVAWCCCQPCAIVQEAREGGLQRNTTEVDA